MNAKIPSSVSTSTITRRGFLTRAGALSAALCGGMSALQSAAGAAGAEPATTATARRPIGLELYSVRTELARDLPGTLRAVAKMGYEAVEFYAPYFDWSIPKAKEVRLQLDDLGMRSFSTHNGIRSLTPGDSMSKAIELNQILGNRHLILSSAPRVSGLEGWKKLCEQLTTAVDLLKPHGLSTGFHNHQTEWAVLDGSQRIMDVLAANTPKEFVLQLDVGTCVEAGNDPVAWIKDHPGRIKSVHLKDWAPGQDKGYRVLFGEGAAPWKEILAAAESVGGVEYYLLEQEGSRFSEFETAQRCLASWKAMRQR